MIPFTVERRPDTGVNNITLGVWLFLASEVMLFGALFSAYAMLRTSAATWPSGLAVLDLRFGLTHTVLLVAATTCVWRSRRPRGRERWLFVSSAIGLVFVAAKLFEYSGELQRGLRPADDTFLAMYFTLTGLHLAHVVGGLLGNVWAWRSGGRLPVAHAQGRVEALALYWAFVDVVWLVILVLFYLT